MNRAFSGGGLKVGAASVRQANDDTGPSSRPNAGMSGCIRSGCNFQAR